MSGLRRHKVPFAVARQPDSKPIIQSPEQAKETAAQRLPFQKIAVSGINGPCLEPDVHSHGPWLPSVQKTE